MKMYEDLIRTTLDEHIYSDHTYDNVDVRNSFKNPFKRKTKRRLIVVLVVIVIVAVTIIFIALLLAKGWYNYVK